MRRKIISLFIAVALILLAGCQQTPDSPVVEMKGGADKYESLAKTDEDETNTLNEVNSDIEQEENINTLIEELGVPEAYDADMTDSSGAITLKADGAVFTIPNVDHLSVKTAVNQEFTAEEIAKFAEVLLGDADLYEHNTFFSQRPKSEYEDTLIQLQKWKAEGILDPYDYGLDQDGNPVFNIDEAIEYQAQAYAEASENPEWEITSKVLGENYTYDYDEATESYSIKKINENHIYGGAILENGRSYTLGVGTYNGSADNYPVLTQYRSFLAMNNASYAFSIDKQLNPFSYMSESMTTKIDTSSLQMTEEEAITFANNLLSELGIEGLQLDHVEYYSNTITQLADDYYMKPIYGLSYVRIEDNVPFTYSGQRGDAIESMESYDEPWPYEKLTILVDDEGLVCLEYVNPNKILETVAENVQLLSYDQISDIFENMIMIKLAGNLSEYIKNVDIEIKEIKLGYMRVLDPDNRETGLIIPVWDFYGSYTLTYDPESNPEMTEDSYTIDYKYNSILTINAVDGTIIDRDLGY